MHSASDSPLPCFPYWKTWRITVPEWQWVRKLAWATNCKEIKGSVYKISLGRDLGDFCWLGTDVAVAFTTLFSWPSGYTKPMKERVTSSPPRNTEWSGSCSQEQFDAFTFISSCLYFNQTHSKHTILSYWMLDITLNRWILLALAPTKVHANILTALNWALMAQVTWQ